MKEKANKIITRASENAKKVALKTLDEKLNQAVENGDIILPKDIKNKISDIPVVGSYLSPKVDTAVNKVADTLAKQTKKLIKGQTDTDMLIIGAGLSGIAMATRLKKSRPLDRFMILERRADMGGTWDLFKYPGIRSDSDMTTFCFADHPWHGNQTLASGDAIKSYIKDTAKNTGVNKYIRYGKSVETMSWSSSNKFWSITVRDVAENTTEIITAKFVVGATGYYDFKQGYTPKFEGEEDFNGDIIHPQKWSVDYQYDGKKVVIIGSGATAVTLLPALLDSTGELAGGQKASHVTMLQRRATYIASVASEDNMVDYLANKWQVLPKDTAYEVKRWKHILLQQGSYRFARVAPKAMKAFLKFGVKQETKGSGVSLDHFTPDYDPWDERVCAVPDGDLFKQLQTGNADVVTDHIERFTETGIQLKSGKHLEADIIVTATGLNLQMLGGANVFVDDEEIKLGDKMTYKAVMVEDIPNMVVMFGYTNASWTLKVDVATVYVTRLLNHMSKNGHKIVIAKSTTHDGTETVQQQADDTVMGALSAGYVQRAVNVLPKQGDRYPWQVTNNYLTDRVMLLHRKVKDEWLRFEG